MTESRVGGKDRRLPGGVPRTNSKYYSSSADCDWECTDVPSTSSTVSSFSFAFVVIGGSQFTTLGSSNEVSESSIRDGRSCEHLIISTPRVGDDGEVDKGDVDASY